MRFGLAGVVFALLIAFSGAPRAGAHEYTLKTLTIGHPWSQPTPGGVKTAVVYVTFVNDGHTADRLLKVSSPMAASASLHIDIKDGTISRMRPLDSIDIPAGQTVELKPGGMHIMLIGLTHPLKEGEMFPLTLTFANEGDVPVEVMVMQQ